MSADEQTGEEDARALALDKQAIMVEYLGTQFERAAATLREALEALRKEPTHAVPCILAAEKPVHHLLDMGSCPLDCSI